MLVDTCTQIDDDMVMVSLYACPFPPPKQPLQVGSHVHVHM